jgi:hypothetical protein
MKVDRRWLVVILVFFGGLLYFQSWAGAQWRENQGPDLLAKDHQGNLYVMVKSVILRYDPQGKYLDQRDLKTIGIETLTGGISFFPNGDLLMVPQNFAPNILEKLLATYRITKPTPSFLASGLGKLSRCKWQDLTCEPLPNFPDHFTRVLWTDIDEHENIFLANTSQHKVYWLDSKGNVLDTLEDSEKIQFPNQLKRNGDFLWLANCNDNSLTKIPLLDKKFSREYQRYPSRKKELPAADRWPTGIAILEDDYFVLSQGGNLRHGSIYRANGNGDIKDVFPKEFDDDLIALVTFNNEVLAADFMGLHINRYSKYGARLGDFTSPELDVVLSNVKSEQIAYRKIEDLCKKLFWLALVVGFVVAYLLEKRHKAKVQKLDSEIELGVVSNNYPPAISDKRIQWLRYNFLLRNFNKWVLWFWAPLILLNVPLLLSAEEESVSRASFFLMVHGLTLLGLINSHRLTNKQLGALVPWVLLKINNSDVAIEREQEILSYTMFGRTVLMIGNQDILVKAGKRKKIFEGDLANDYINRLVESSRSISLSERWAWLFEHKFHSLMWEFLLALLYLVILMVANMHH